MGVGIAAFGGGGIQWGFSFCSGTFTTVGGPEQVCTTVNKIDAGGNNKNANALDQIPGNGFGPIAVSWLMSPIISGVIAAALFGLTRVLILDDNFITLRMSKITFFRAIYVAPFFYGLMAAILVVMLAYKGVASTGNASALQQINNTPEQLTAGAVVTGIIIMLLAYVYVSYWQYRTNWLGEEFHWFECE